MSFMTENIYDVNDWVRDIRNLVTTMYNGTEYQFLTGSDLKALI